MLNIEPLILSITVCFSLESSVSYMNMDILQNRTGTVRILTLCFNYNRYPYSLAREAPFFAYFPVTELTGTQIGTKSVTFCTGIVWSCLPSNRTKIDVLGRETRLLSGKIITGRAQVYLPLSRFSYESRCK